MNDDSFSDQCADLTQEMRIMIPCRLAERVDAYAAETDSTIAGVVIEALDVFLRGRSKPSS